MRSDAKGQECLEDHSNFPDRLSYTIVPDMTSSGAFKKAVQASPVLDAVIHMASPFTYDVTDVKRDMIDPAVQGTTQILKSISDFAPSVQRVVITSSFAAVINFQQPVPTYTSDNWNPITEEQALSGGQMAYVGSKTFAERAAWDFVRTRKPNFTLTTVNPVMVFGPVTYRLRSLDGVNTSNAFFRDVITGSMKDGVPANSFQWVDVRDVALAHVRAIEVPEAGGKRFLAAAGPYSNAQIASIIREKFPEMQDRIPRQDVAPKDEVGFTVDCGPMTNILGVKFRSLEEATVDTVKSLLKVQGEHHT